MYGFNTDRAQALKAPKDLLIILERYFNLHCGQYKPAEFQDVAKHGVLPL
jgi:hypothetical protein